MGLSNKHKQYIRDQYRKKSPEQISRELRIDSDEVRAFISTFIPQQNNKKNALFFITALLIPVLFFALLEGSLRLFSYRGDTSLFTFPDQYFQGEFGLANRNFNARYFFNTTNLPGFSNDAFLANKPDSSFRVFVMGGSTTAGYPYGFNAMFSRVTADALKDVMPGRLVEVVNLGASAVNTYTLYDQIPEILAQKPDAIFIYTGHNEFYGALGVGSSEQFGAFPGFVRAYLKLQRLKTFLLLRDGIATFSEWLARTLGSGHHPARDGTLMQRMVQDQSITLDSRTFELGKNQFRSNLGIILKTFQNHNIPVFISSISSNLKDQEPFISIRTEDLPPASEIFQQASYYYGKNEFEKAYKLFVYAKDLDALKFRAPEVFNEIIKDKAQRYGAIYVPAYESMKAQNEPNIIGFDLMLEHLHPNQYGYFLIGMSFFDAMKKTGFLGMVSDTAAERSMDEYFERMLVTDMDHRIAYHRVQLLTSGWPFVDEPKPNGYPRNHDPVDFVDQVAFDVVNTSKRWDEAKLEIADFFIENGDYEKAVREYEGLIRDQPYNDSPYQLAGLVILQILNDFERAKPYFESAWRINPSNYSARMLGSIEVNDGNFARGINLLNKAIELNSNDVQAMFNLSGAQALSGDLQKAHKTAKQLEQLQPAFPGLSAWLDQLENQLRKSGQISN